MGFYLNVGNAGFQAIRKEVYVDKTGLITFINSTLGTKRKLTCVGRPRRFGKSYAVQMLGGVPCPIDVGTFQNDMTSIKCKDDVLTLLVHLGYLAYNADLGAVYIPNEEVRREFIRGVAVSKHKEVARLVQNSDRLLKATLSMDQKTVAEMIEEMHRKNILV